MSSPTTVTFVGAKGGVGTSTVAALHAIQLARLGRTVRLSATDGVDDLAAILGVPCPGPDDTANVLPGLTLGEERCTEPDAVNVIDAGTDCFSDRNDSAVYLVLRNDYQSLRRALNAPRTTTGLVLVTEAQRSPEPPRRGRRARPANRGRASPGPGDRPGRGRRAAHHCSPSPSRPVARSCGRRR
jgi:hypothetical protein